LRRRTSTRSLPPDTQFLLDANLSPALARRMSGAGFPSLQVATAFGPTVSDRDIVAHANRLQAAIVSKDADFRQLVQQGVLRTALVWLHYWNISTPQLWLLLEPNLPSIVARIAAGQQLIELSR
jgi:predicted nuclease of predicted toxin-antitoxin system